MLSARLIWTYASCYRVLGDAQYLSYAQRAYHWFIRHFWDAEYGGAYTAVRADGQVTDDHKMTYGNSFALYALAEYHRATGDAEALDYARQLAARLEQHVWDPLHKGYFECCDRDWTPNPWLRGVNRSPFDEKTMNTHLHLTESYTCLLRADKAYQSQVRRLLHLMIDKVLDQTTGHYHIFQDRAWHPTTQEVSYGHDIEGSWLMLEAAEVLGEPEAITYARAACLPIARACYTEGLRGDGAMLSHYDPHTRQSGTTLSWWEQNEAVVGFLNAWEMTGEEQFLAASLRSFQLIHQLFVDHEQGGWFAVLDAGGKPISQNKCDGYTCPYHNARMCLEIIERYLKHAG